jgi:hypothetical protein
MSGPSCHDALLGLAPVRSAHASAATTWETRVQQTIN